jgi:hypothetical protein
MVLHGELAVGAFDLLFTRAAADTENFVIIAFSVVAQRDSFSYGINARSEL